MPNVRRPQLRVTGAILVGLLLAALLTVLAAPASADTAPVDPNTPVTVSADALPTVQVNGVVWAQVVAGNRVYATGRFTSARPAGSPAGSNEVARSNILAFDLTTGALVASWNPSLNAQGLAIAASPDGSRIYVVGEFTQASGVTRNRVAAFDAATGSLVTSFAPSLNSRARAIAVTTGNVYVGGSFTQAGGQTRQRLAAFSTANGALTAWAPTAEQEVFSMTAPPGFNKIVVGGRFTRLNGALWYGMGALDATSAAVLPWAATSVVRNAGPDAAIQYLTSNSSGVYGTGYVFGGGGNFEGSFAAESADGALRWVNGCLGDTYGIATVGPVAYSVGHPHNCSQIGYFPEQNPRQWQRALATTSARGPGNRSNLSGPFQGRPAPAPLHWLPTIPNGTFTGQFQGPWAISTTSNYVVLGGEFPSINGTPQQGLARFAVRAIAPNQQGPQGQPDLRPTLQVTGVTVRATFRAAWDRDNRRLNYELLRGGSTASATVVATLAGDSEWWSRGQLTMIDPVAPGGTQTYRIRVRDPLGNTVVGPSATVTVGGAGAAAVAPQVAEGAPQQDAVEPAPVEPGAAQAAAVENTSAYARDGFDRSSPSGLGSADSGGAWTTTGDTADLSVSDGTANVRVPAAGEQRGAHLGGVSQTDVAVSATVKLDKVPVDGTVSASVIGRRVDSADYRVTVEVAPAGAVTARLARVADGTATALGAPATLSGVAYAPGQLIRVRLQVVGSGTTLLAATVWPDGSSEPSAAHLTASDTAPVLQAPGAVGVAASVSGAATNAPLVASFDDLTAGSSQAG